MNDCDIFKKKNLFWVGKIMNKNENIILRNIHDAYFLVDITDNFQDDKCTLYEINEIGKVIWDNINNNGIDEITSIIYDLIVDDIDYSVIHDDVSNFIDLLIKNNFVV